MMFRMNPPIPAPSLEGRTNFNRVPKLDPCEARALAKRLFRKSTRETFPLTCAFRASARLKLGTW